MTAPQRMVPCPRCGTRTPFAPANPWRPFCSERCKLIDLGNWAKENYRVPDDTSARAEDEPQPKK
ncbi:MAG: DNA gyrase inhibitor YacG [Burkholderiales bacterium]